MKLKQLFEKKDLRTSATAWVILYTSDKLILGKRAPSVNNPNQWCFMGGHVDQGESVKAAAVRELEEEAGYKLSESDLKEVAIVGQATYFAAKISDPEKLKLTAEVSKIKGFKLTDLPDNLHAKTENFFNRLDTIFK